MKKNLLRTLSNKNEVAQSHVNLKSIFIYLPSAHPLGETFDSCRHSWYRKMKKRCATITQILFTVSLLKSEYNGVIMFVSHDVTAQICVTEIPPARQE